MKRVLALCALAGASCSTQEAVCDRLTAALQDCGFEVQALDCSRITEGDLDQLSQQFGDRKCSGFSTGDGSVDPRLCALTGWKCPTSPMTEPQHTPPQFPMVLVSGIDGAAVFDWNPRIQQGLTDWGAQAHHVQVLPWATTPDRADDLWQSLRSLRSHLGNTRLNLVCYAVGGLDCRYLVSPGGLFKDDAAQLAEVQDAVASITTVSTPHRGTQVAEAALDALQNGTANDLLQAFVGDKVSVMVPDDAQVEKTLDGLGLDALDAFNAAVIDAPNVRYFSWAGVSQAGGHTSQSTEDSIARHCVDASGNPVFFRHEDTRDSLALPLLATAPFSFESHAADGSTVHSPSDGMVSVESAKWGTFMGCLPADHYDVVGEIGHTTRDPQTGFDPAVLMRVQAAFLSAEGL